MNISELRSKSESELQTEILDLRKEQFNLRMQRGAEQLVNNARFKVVRKSIARIKTVLNEKSGNQ